MVDGSHIRNAATFTDRTIGAQGQFGIGFEIVNAWRDILGQSNRLCTRRVIPRHSQGLVATTLKHDETAVTGTGHTAPGCGSTTRRGGVKGLCRVLPLQNGLLQGIDVARDAGGDLLGRLIALG